MVSVEYDAHQSKKFTLPGQAWIQIFPKKKEKIVATSALASKMGKIKLIKRIEARY